LKKQQEKTQKKKEAGMGVGGHGWFSKQLAHYAVVKAIEVIQINEL